MRLGTLGIGIEARKHLVNHLGLRAGFNLFTIKDNGQKLGDTKYDLEAKFRSFNLLLDLSPGATGSFHLTGGVITSPVKATGSNSGATFKVNDHTYPGKLDMSVKYSGAMPYLGLGFGTAAHRGIAFVFDLGVAIGKPKFSLSSTASGATLQSDLDAETAKRQDDVNKIPGYPILAFGLIYRF